MMLPLLIVLTGSTITQALFMRVRTTSVKMLLRSTSLVPLKICISLATGFTKASLLNIRWVVLVAMRCCVQVAVFVERVIVTYLEERFK
jgi:hypothetical protein